MKDVKTKGISAKEAVENIADAIEVVEPINVLATIKVGQLIDVSTWREKQEKLVVDNPYLEVVDNKTYEDAKKRRTALVKGRTELQNQKKPIKALLSSVGKEVEAETDALIDITLPHEEKQQEAVKNWEDRKAREKKEKDDAEELRVKTIKNKIDALETDSYAIIQKVEFAGIDKAKLELSKLVDEEFDYEEYDILLDQVKDRIAIAWDSKVETLTNNENQRLENIQLAKENAEVKRLSDLQASRLNEIMPYVAFGEAVDLTKLSELEQSTYDGVLASKKALFDADLLEKQRVEEERLENEKKEKDAIFEIRKSRFKEIGIDLEPEHNGEITIFDSLSYSFGGEEETVELSRFDVYDTNTLDFEDILSKIKSTKQKWDLQNEQAEKEKVDSLLKTRIELLLSIGFIYDAEREYPYYLSDGIFINEEILRGRDEEWFSEYVKEANAYQKQQNEKLAKSDADKLKAENKARVVKYYSDKKGLYEFIDGLEFNHPSPDLENEDMVPVLQSIFSKVLAFKKDLLELIKNL